MANKHRKFKSPAEELAFYRERNSAGGHARAAKMTKAQRSLSAKHARSFGVGGSRNTASAAQQAEAAADKILAGPSPKRAGGSA